MNPFDFVRSINEKQIVKSMVGYNPYLCNHSLSYSLDTSLLANEMNRYPNLPPECQYDFLYGTVRKGKRYNKWYKYHDHPFLELVMNHYQCSKQKALEALTVLTQSDIKSIIQSGDKGGNSV